MIKKSNVSGSERDKEMKQLKRLAYRYLNFYLSLPKESDKRKKGWRDHLVARNVTLLKNIILKLNENLEKDKKIEYVDAINFTSSLSNDATAEERQEEIFNYEKNFEILMSQDFAGPLLFKIVMCSPRFSYQNDFTWFKHGTVQEQVEYGIGVKDITVFEKYLPDQITFLEEIKVAFFSKEDFKDDSILMETILTLVGEEKFVPANILIITLIEGLVRKFSYLVYKKQNCTVNETDAEKFIYDSGYTFETLISKLTWRNDIPISYAELITAYSHTDKASVTDLEKKLKKHSEATEKVKSKLTEWKELLVDHIESSNLTDDEVKIMSLKKMDEVEKELKNLLSDEDKIIYVGLDVYLDFLVRKFKDDRNKIIHGKYSLFKEKWNALVYLTALEVLIKKIIWYEKTVGFQTNQ